jgi:hypothetical protein
LLQLFYREEGWEYEKYFGNRRFNKKL